MIKGEGAFDYASSLVAVVEKGVVKIAPRDMKPGSSVAGGLNVARDYCASFRPISPRDVLRSVSDAAVDPTTCR